MRLRKRTIGAFLVLCSAVVWATGRAEGADPAANYPNKPIQFVVPANPGGGTDIGARLLAEYLAPEIGTSIIITNMNGAGGTVASNYVNDAEPDGYTLLYQHEGFVANRVFGLSNLTLHDLVTAGGTFEVDTVCLFSKKLRSWDDLVQTAKQRQVILGTEVGTSFHILFEAIKDRAKLANLKFVDTGAVSPTLAAMEGDQIDVALVPMGVIVDAVRAGRYHVLALVSSKERSKFAPDVPTLSELGVDVYMPKFFFQAFPPKTPASIVAKFRAALERAMKNPKLLERAAALYYKAAYLTPEQIYGMEQVNYDVMMQYISLLKKK